MLKRKTYRCGNLHRPLLGAGIQAVLAIEAKWAKVEVEVMRPLPRVQICGRWLLDICVFPTLDADQAEAICQRLIDMVESGLSQAGTVCW